jgi:hypothetical protein
MAEDTLPLPEPRTLSRGDEDGPIQLGYTADQLRAYAEQVAAARVAPAVAQEQERCAAICEEHYSIEGIAQDIAAAIRAGSPSPQPAPAGWRWVPEKWTREMRHAFIHAAAATITGRETAGWEAALAAAPQPPSAWRPIEEAPRDQTLLVWHSSYSRPAVGHVLAGDLWGCFLPGTPLLFQPHLDPAPTHWQPLPPPPSAGEERKE